MIRDIERLKCLLGCLIDEMLEPLNFLVVIESRRSDCRRRDGR